MNKSIISVTLLVLLFVGSIETFAQKQIVRRVPNEPVVPQKQAQPTKTPTHHAPKKNREKKKREYEFVDGYVEELARVCLNDKWGFIDKSGRLVIPCKYDDSGSFSEGLAEVGLKDESGYYKYGFIDKSGTEVIPCMYYYARPFHDGRALIGLNGKYGFIDKSGTEVIPCKYWEVYSFSEGLALIRLNGKYGFIDKSGTEVIPCKYEDAHIFCNGRAKVQLNGKQGYVNKSGVETWD